jgi:hypothetical protein
MGAYWKTKHAPTDAHVRMVELLAEAAAVALTSEYVSVRVSEAITARPIVRQRG